MNSQLMQQIAGIMASGDPRINQLHQMMAGKTPQQLEQIARNMAAQRGTTVEDIARSLGITIPSNR